MLQIIQEAARIRNSSNKALSKRLHKMSKAKPDKHLELLGALLPKRLKKHNDFAQSLELLGGRAPSFFTFFLHERPRIFEEESLVSILSGSDLHPGPSMPICSRWDWVVINKRKQSGFVCFGLFWFGLFWFSFGLCFGLFWFVVVCFGLFVCLFEGSEKGGQA